MKKTIIVLGAIVAVVYLAMTLYANYISNHSSFKWKQTRALMEELHGAISQYHEDCGEYPPTLDGLLTSNLPNVCGGRVYLTDNRVPTDRWGNEFLYKLSPSGFELTSFGSDRASGGDGDQADIVFPRDRF